MPVDLEQAIDAEGFPLQLSTERLLEGLSGFLPVTSGQEVSGFECYHDDPGELIEDYQEIADFDRPWKHVLSFRFGADLTACLAAYTAAAAYAKATDGIVFDPQDAVIMTPQRAIDLARGMERDLREE